MVEPLQSLCAFAPIAGATFRMGNSNDHEPIDVVPINDIERIPLQ
jgi:hypothetical protein